MAIKKWKGTVYQAYTKQRLENCQIAVTSPGQDTIFQQTVNDGDFEFDLDNKYEWKAEILNKKHFGITISKIDLSKEVNIKNITLQKIGGTIDIKRGKTFLYICSALLLVIAL